MQERRPGKNRGNATLRGKVGKDRDEAETTPEAESQRAS